MIGHIIYTYNKINDARINQELSREVLGGSEKFGGVYIVHAYNGNKKFGYEKYLEDELINIKNRGHFQGAVDLINAGIKSISKRKDIRYILVTASDTWFIKREFIENLIERMRKEDKYIAVSAWGISKDDSIFKMGFSQDFFILDLEWNRKSKFYPIDYDKYLDKFLDISHAVGGTFLVPERAVSYYWLRYWYGKGYKDNDLGKMAREKILRIAEREPIHSPDWSKRKMEWPELGLYTWHDAELKQKLLKGIKSNISIETDGNKLLQAKELSYFNKI